MKRGSRRVLATCCLNTSPSRVATRVQRDDFPTSSPMTISGLLGGAMVVSSNHQADRKPSLRHPHYLAVAPAPSSFLSVVRSGERLRWQHPRPSSGQGQTAIRRRSIGGPSGFARIVGNAPNTRHRSSSVAYLGMQWVSMHLSERAISLQLEWPPFALRGRFCVENASVFGTGSKLMNAPCPATAIVLVV